jgi:hypothetical protein
LYAIYKSLHIRAQLYDFCIYPLLCPVGHHDGLHLFQLLETWVGPTLTFDFRKRKFLSPRLYLRSKNISSEETTIFALYVWEVILADTREEALAEAGGRYVRGVWTHHWIRSRITSA